MLLAKPFCNARANAFGATSHDCNLTIQISIHIRLPFINSGIQLAGFTLHTTALL
jgi:hypothetical protein